MASFGFSFRASLSTRSMREQGRIYLRIVQRSQSRSVTTPYRVWPDEWNPQARRLVMPYARTERARQLAEIESRMMADARRMEAVIADLERATGGDYSADQLINKYRAVMSGNTVGAYTDRLATEMERAGLNRTAKGYRSAAARLIAFNRGRDPHMDQLSPALINDFAAELKSEGRAPNTISFYMRTLRAIYHKSIVEGRTPRRPESPFAGVYTGVAPTRKLALSHDDLALLSSHDPTLDPAAQQPKQHLPDFLAPALAMFLFCFHARGMCFVDMAHLKKSDLRTNTIVYRRHKTSQPIELHVLPPMRRIIDWFARRNPASPYIFPVIADPAKDPIQQYESGLRLQNTHLKKIAVFCGIKTNFSTHSARHSWATVAKSAALPIAVISEGLGHSNQKTTEIYLASLERSILDNAARLVSNAIIPAAQHHPETQQTQPLRQPKPKWSPKILDQISL